MPGSKFFYLSLRLNLLSLSWEVLPTYTEPHIECLDSIHSHIFILDFCNIKCVGLKELKPTTYFKNTLSFFKNTNL